MRLKTNKDIVDFIKTEGVKNFPKESCGVIAKVGRKAVPFACENISADPEHQFLMNPEDYIAVSDKHEIIGIWHTHINITNQPSVADKVGCENSELPWMIMNIRKTIDDEDYTFSDINIITPNGFELPYLERPYVFGVLDCYTLVRDYYKREFGVKLKDVFRIENWWTKGYNLFEDSYKDVGFVDVQGDEFRVGDLLFLQIETDTPNHCAIYIGDDTILHHLYGRLSSTDVYSGYYRKHTSYHLRHKELL